MMTDAHITVLVDHSSNSSHGYHIYVNGKKYTHIMNPNKKFFTCLSNFSLYQYKDPRKEYEQT